MRPPRDPRRSGPSRPPRPAGADRGRAPDARSGDNQRPDPPRNDYRSGDQRRPDPPRNDSRPGEQRRPDPPRNDSRSGEQRRPDPPRSDYRSGEQRRPDPPRNDFRSGEQRRPEQRRPDPPRNDFRSGDNRRPDPPRNDFRRDNSRPPDPRRQPDPRQHEPRHHDARHDPRRQDARRQDSRRPEPPRPAHLAQKVRPGDPTPFELFCAYHLGIAKDGTYRPANIHTVARQFNKPAGELKQLLQDYGIDATAVMEKEFDMAMAQIDMELAPEGIHRVELARPLFEEFLAAPRKKIDWKKIIDEDIRENSKVFGRRD